LTDIEKKRQLDLSSVIRDKTDINTQYTIWFNHFITDGHMKIVGITNFAVYAFLRADYSYQANWKGFPPWVEIQDKTGLTYKTIKKSVGELEGLEYIKVKWKSPEKKTKPLTYKIVEKIHYKNPLNPEEISGYSMVMDKLDMSAQKRVYEDVSKNKTIAPSQERRARWELDYKKDFTPIINKYYVNVVVGDNNKVTIFNEEPNMVMGEKLGLIDAFAEDAKKRQLTKGKVKKILEANPEILPANTDLSELDDDKEN